MGWLDFRARTVGDRHRGAKGRYTDHDRFGEPTPAESLAACKAHSADVFTTEAADYDLAAAGDIYSE